MVDQASEGRATLKAWLFDLDGVVTDTAAIHSRSWKRLFDEFLERRAGGGAFEPLKLPDDYLAHIDGKPRYEGVRDFLASRGIVLPMGTPDDPPGDDTVCALGNAKNDYFNEVLARDAVPVFERCLALIEQLRAGGRTTACVSSSKNCRPVLRAAGLEDRFDAVVDGTDLEARGLRGKPEPDSYLAAAEAVGADAATAVVLEDALSGVEAGKRGGFGLVVGIDRGAGAEALRAAGAHRVVADAGDLVDDPVVTGVG